MDSSSKHIVNIFIKWYLFPAFIFTLLLGIGHTAASYLNIFDSLSASVGFLTLLGLISLVGSIIYYPVITYKKMSTHSHHLMLWTFSGFLLILILLGLWGLAAHARGLQFDDFNESLLGRHSGSVIINFPK